MGDSCINVTPRRLSKPRTIKSSSNLMSDLPTTPSSPHNTSDQDYFGQDAVVVNAQGERRSRSKSRSKIRAYLYGSNHDALQTSSDDEETQSGIAGAARDVRKRLSRTGSSIATFQNAKGSSTRLSNSSSSGLLSIRSIEQQGVDPEESAMVADQIKQRAYHDSLVAQNHVSTPLDEDKHVDSIMAPLRRKSLYTPGIATRNASDILRKPPKPSMGREYYHDPSRPETSPLSQLASMYAGEDGRSTPCSLHYSQLGGLQLGTLRVTNGASSPAPGDNSPDLVRLMTPESKTNDEYYTASEGSMTEHFTPLPLRGGSPLKYYHSQMDDSNDRDATQSLSFERESSNESFPFSREHKNQEAGCQGWGMDQSVHSRRETISSISRREDGTSNEPSNLTKGSSKAGPVEAMEPNDLLTPGKEPKQSCFLENESCGKTEYLHGAISKGHISLVVESPQNCDIDGVTLDESFPSNSEIPNEASHFERETLSESSLSKTTSLKSRLFERRKPDDCSFEGNSANGASDIANEYIAELDGSPFSSSSLDDKRSIKTQSQDSAKEMWSSFINDAEVQHAGKCSGSREDAFRRLTGNGNTTSTLKSEILSVPSSQPSRYSASSVMPQTDSGYSSYASLTGAPTDNLGFEIEAKPVPSTNVTASPQSQAIEDVRSSARSSFRIPIRKLKKQRPKSQPPPANLITGYHELTGANIPRIPSVIAARHANRLSHFPLLEHTFPSSQHTTANGTLSPVQAREMPIRFPSPANALEAAAVPLGSSPIASSKSRASTIVVDEDVSGTSNLVRSPSWSEFGGGRRRKEEKKLAKEKSAEKRLLKEEKQLGRRLQKDRKDLGKLIKNVQNKQRSTDSRSTSRTRTRSSEGQSRHETLVTIADFGTVTESLGNSPYDIARPMFANPQIGKNWHPYQISTGMPRPHTPFGARNRAQTMFLDVPSVPALAAVDIKVHNLEWARNRQRSQSYFAAKADSSNNRVGIPGRAVRPHRVAMDPTPPVPALPSSNQVKRREAEIMRSRPQSMVVEAPVPNPATREVEGKTAIPHPSQSSTSATPPKTIGSKIIPSLWSNGSLERKSAKTVEGLREAFNGLTNEDSKATSTNDTFWEIQSNAWSQRRKSAGEALLRNQVGDAFDGQEAADPTLFCESNGRPTTLARVFTSGACQTFTPTPDYLGPFPNPLASPPSLGPLMSSLQHANQTPPFNPSRAQFQIQRKRVGSGPSAIRAESAIGPSRYEGVLV